MAVTSAVQADDDGRYGERRGPSRGAPRALGPARIRLREILDRFVGFDPGLTQIRNAGHAVIALSAAVFIGYLFSSVTGAMKIDGTGLPPASVAAQHHGALIVAMIIPGIIAMLDSTNVNDGTVRTRLITSAMLPLVFLAAMAAGLTLAGHRPALLIWLVVAPVIAVYLRRFPPRGFVSGVVLFNGAFMAYFMHALITPRDLGWVAALLYLGAGSSVAVRYFLFRPDNRRALLRIQRAWVARSHTLIDLALQLTDELPDRRRERLNESIQRNLVRLNESSLMIDAQLAQPEAVEGSAMVLHQRLFDQELALSNVVRFTGALVAKPLSGPVYRGLRDTLRALRGTDTQHAVAIAQAMLIEQRDARRAGQGDDNTTVLVHRFSRSVADLVGAQREWLSAGAQVDSDGPTFVPAVELMGGFLPGSKPVSEAAGDVRGRALLDRPAVKPYVRSSVQIAVAATIAVVIGDLLDGRRLYWALLATFLSFLATSNSGEQVRKAFFRLSGTALGILIGDLLVHAAGRNLVVSLVIVVVALFVGFYLVRINYMFLVVGITVTMSQLYVQLNEFSWQLLLLRLAETAVGVAAVVVTVVTVLPLRPQRVLGAAITGYLTALQNLTANSLSVLCRLGEDIESRPPTRLDVRELDSTYQSLVATAQPLRFGMFGRRATQLHEGLAVASATRYYARNLEAGVEFSDLPGSAELDRAAARLLESMTALRERAETGEHRTYVRSAALFDHAYRQLPGHDPESLTDMRLVIRDVMLLDGALARLARALQMTVTDTDTDGSVVDVARSSGSAGAAR